MKIVRKDSDGNYYIGPLTENQYLAIVYSVEIAILWTHRGVHDVAKALLSFIVKEGKEKITDLIELPDISEVEED